jgi:hypothetical protein
MALRDWPFGEPNTSAFGAFLERIHQRLPSLYEGFASVLYSALSQYRLTHPLLLLCTGHSPVITAVPASPLVEPVKSNQCHSSESCHDRTVGAGLLRLHNGSRGVEIVARPSGDADTLHGACVELVGSDRNVNRRSQISGGLACFVHDDHLGLILARG